MNYISLSSYFLTMILSGLPPNDLYLIFAYFNAVVTPLNDDQIFLPFLEKQKRCVSSFQILKANMIYLIKELKRERYFYLPLSSIYEQPLFLPYVHRESVGFSE